MKQGKIFSMIVAFFICTILVTTFSPTVKGYAITTEQETAVRNELYQMLSTGDYAKRDLSQYNLRYSELDAIWSKLIHNEGYLLYQSHAKVILQTTQSQSGRVLQVGLLDLDGKDSIARYSRVLASIAEVKSKITDSMSESEKVLFVHEYIVEKTYYKKSGHISYMGGGPLGDGYGVCEGYAYAMIVLLKEVGIECYYVSSTSMNHGWVLAKVDGDWYHIDPTWDDTLDNDSGKGSNTSHRFFMKNSNEYSTDSKKHYSWTFLRAEAGVISTSTKYSDWFVHNVYGVMRYEDGLWYYIDPGTNSIVRSTISGDSYSVVVENDGTKTYILRSIQNGELTYTENGSEKIINVNCEMVEEPEIDLEEPVSYTPIDNLQITTGASSFNTGYNVTSKSTVILEFELTNANKYRSFIKAYTASTNRLEFRQEATQGIYVAYGWYNSKVCSPAIGEKLTIAQIANKTYINDQLVRTATAQTYQVNNTLTIDVATIKFYRCIIKEGDNIIHEYIPVVDLEGVKCLYDLITEEYLYTN